MVTFEVKQTKRTNGTRSLQEYANNTLMVPNHRTQKIDVRQI